MNRRIAYGLTLALLAAAPARAQEATPVPEPTPEPQHTGVLRQIGRDFRHMADWDNLAILAGGGVAALAVHGQDQQISDDWSGSDGLDETLDAGQVGGGGIVQIGGAVATYAVGRFSHNASVRSLGSDLIRAQIVSGSLTLALKAAAQRTRPDGSNNASFPSGHTSTTFATAAVLQSHFGWKVGVPAFAFGVYVGCSRVQEAKHFPSDVLFGAALGLASGRAVTFGHTRLTVAPVAVRTGAGIQVFGSFGGRHS